MSEQPEPVSRPTMKDVAARAGVCLKTVSRVVNDEPGVTAAMRGRVHAAIQELGFRRNDEARLMRTRRTASIALITDDIADPFCAGLARSVENVARQHGYVLFIGSTDQDSQREKELILTFCARRVEGLVIVPASVNHSYLAPELAAGVSCVFIGQRDNGAATDVVLADYAQEIGRAAGELLMRRIAGRQGE